MYDLEIKIKNYNRLKSDVEEFLKFVYTTKLAKDHFFDKSFSIRNCFGKYVRIHLYGIEPDLCTFLNSPYISDKFRESAVSYKINKIGII